MYFKDEGHKERYCHLVERDGTEDNDCYRDSLFYLLASEKSLYRKIGKIYDFKRRQLKLEYRYNEGEKYIEESPEYSSREKMLIKFAVNLNTGHQFTYMNPSYIFGYIGGREMACVALKAMGIRYGVYMDFYD